MPEKRPPVLPEDLTALFDMAVWNRSGPPWNCSPRPTGHVLRNFATAVEAEPLVQIADSGGPAWLIKEDADRIPSDNHEYAEFLATFVRLINKDYPGLKYVHLVNEPNVYWYKHFSDFSQAYIEYFLTIAKRLHLSFPTWP